MHFTTVTASLIGLLGAASASQGPTGAAGRGFRLATVTSGNVVPAYLKVPPGPLRTGNAYAIHLTTTFDESQARVFKFREDTGEIYTTFEGKEYAISVPVPQHGPKSKNLQDFGYVGFGPVKDKETRFRFQDNNVLVDHPNLPREFYICQVNNVKTGTESVDSGTRLFWSKPGRVNDRCSEVHFKAVIMS